MRPKCGAVACACVIAGQEGLGHAVRTEEVHREVPFEPGALAQAVVKIHAGVIDEDIERSGAPDGWIFISFSVRPGWLQSIHCVEPAWPPKLIGAPRICFDAILGVA